MERLSVYDDYVQTIRLLRGAKNRVLNGLETRQPADPALVTQCQGMVQEIHGGHLDLGKAIVEALDAAMRARDIKRATDMSNKLHRYNRYTVKITRVFERDIEEEHPNPEGDDSDKPVDPARPVRIETFHSNLMTLKSRSVQKPRPATPKPPQPVSS